MTIILFCIKIDEFLKIGLYIMNNYAILTKVIRKVLNDD